MTRITGWQVHARIGELAREIAKDYQGLDLELLGLLNGGAQTTVWLQSALYGLGMNARSDYMRIESYGQERESNRRPEITAYPKNEIKGDHVLLVDDVGDTQHSLAVAWAWAESRGPASLAALALVSKVGVEETQVHLKYIGFQLPPEYFVGSGMDAAELYRGFPGIGAMVKNED